MKLLALLLFTLTLPLTLLLALLLLLSRGKGVFFIQNRVGKGKKEFRIYKFRTMHEGKITGIGRVLRKIGLDELPQLINIIKGDMAFVGPRPLTQFDIDRLNWNGEEFSARWSVKPGITGQAQLVKICDANLSMQQDLDYVKNKSFGRDLKVFFRSLMVPFVGKLSQ
jgi:lipopolysaccharide/colanic/teichoic acid biosynthesis glycosyltransferase